MDVFKKFEQDDIVKANPAEVSTGLWTGDTGSLALFHISAAQSASAGGQYYYDVYNDNVITSSAEVQFAVAYGNIHGHGAETLTENDNALLPTKSTYFQYRNILLEPDDTNFSFLPASGSGTYDSDDIYVINIKRSRLKEKLDPGNWSLI